MFFTIIKTLAQSFWILFKPVLIFLVPLIVVFAVCFYAAYIRKKRSGTAQREVIAHVNNFPDETLITKLFVQLPRQYWENFYNKKIGSFGEHGIIIYTGRQGQGKTLTMTRDILKLKFKYPSLEVGTNYGLNDENFVIDDWRKLVDYNNGEKGVLCAIDECQNWFSSSMSKNFPPRMLATVTQNRKNRRVIFMTSHFFTNVAKPIRLHCTEVRACYTFLKCFTVVKRWEPIMDAEGNLIKKRNKGIYCYVHSDELYGSYDTYKIIKNLSESGFVNDNWLNDEADSGLKPAKRAKRARRKTVESDVMRALDNCQLLMENRGSDSGMF